MAKKKPAKKPSAKAAAPRRAKAAPKPRPKSAKKKTAQKKAAKKKPVGTAKIRQGERYRSDAPLDVIAMTSWFAPFTGGCDAVLPAGEEFTISNNPPEGATAVYCDPVRYEELHAHFVSAKDRKSPKYNDYYLCIPLALIAKRCTPVPQ